MKKVFMSVLVLATMLTSCSESSNEVNEVMFQETGSIQALISTAQPANTSARTDVKRGTIYAWVNDVTITAESAITNYTAEEAFDL